MSAPVLELRGILKTFPGVRALDNVDFLLDRGEIRGLVGANGAGKSTLIKILSGVYQKDAGEVYLDGVQVDIKIVRSCMAFVHQEVDIVDHFTVAEAIFLGKEPTRGPLVDWRRLRTKAKEVLDRLDLHIDVSAPVSRLRLAEKQMVAIARVLVESNKVIVFDEPTARLEAEETERLFALIRQLNALGVPIIYVSQRLQEIFEICHSVTVMRNGQNVTTMPIAKTSMEEVIRLMIGTDIKQRYPKRSVPIGEVIFGIRDAACSQQAPGVSFDVRRGEILGIYGAVGAGKTELARAIFGVEKLHKGGLFLEGEPVVVRSPGDAIRRGIVLVPEERRSQGLLPNHGVHQNISLPSLRALQRAGLIHGKRELSVACEMISSLQVKTPGPKTQVRNLSGGNQQKVVLGKWLTTKAQVYILDEPTAGVDVGAKVEIYKLVENLAENGAGIIYISSELEEILGISDRILIMKDGEVVFETERDKTSTDEVLARSLGAWSMDLNVANSI